MSLYHELAVEAKLDEQGESIRLRQVASGQATDWHHLKPMTLNGVQPYSDWRCYFVSDLEAFEVTPANRHHFLFDAFLNGDTLLFQLWLSPGDAKTRAWVEDMKATHSHNAKGDELVWVVVEKGVGYQQLNVTLNQTFGAIFQAQDLFHYDNLMESGATPLSEGFLTSLEPLSLETLVLRLNRGADGMEGVSFDAREAHWLHLLLLGIPLAHRHLLN